MFLPPRGMTGTICLADKSTKETPILYHAKLIVSGDNKLGKYQTKKQVKIGELLFAFGNL